MHYLFKPDGEAELRRLAQGSTLFAFDFDGTLAPIVTRPEQAGLLPAIERLLRQLAVRAQVALVSGRSRADLATRVPSEVRWLIGNHGNEGEGAAEVAGSRAVVAQWRAQLAADTDFAQALAAGAELEDKELSLSLHCRRMREPDAGALRLRAIAERLQPLPMLIGGKRVLNLMPPGSRTKFDAVAALVHEHGFASVLYVGDDDTDEHVFDRAPPHWVTVRVELDRRSRARYFVHQQSSVAMILDFLLRELAKPAVTGGA
jgi:trehalose 6-phosphate phosphatase